MRFPKRSMTSLLALAGLALLLLLSCGPAPTATPLPTSMPAEELFTFLQDENSLNPERVEDYKDDARSSVFEGIITEINDSTVQFHIQKRDLLPDKYIECKFRSKNEVLSLNIGTMVRILGDLEDVNGVVQFKNCQLVPQR